MMDFARLRKGCVAQLLSTPISARVMQPGYTDREQCSPRLFRGRTWNLL